MQTKPAFTFYFTDEPQYAARESREHAAHLLRAWRAKPSRCTVTRIGRNAYLVRLPGHTVSAILAATK